MHCLCVRQQHCVTIIILAFPNKSKAAKSDSAKLSDNEHVMKMLRRRLKNPVARLVNDANKDSYHGHLVKIRNETRGKKQSDKTETPEEKDDA